MAKKEEAAIRAAKLMTSRNNIRNIGIAAHIDHGKTTLSDSLVASAGLISEDLAGKLQIMDFYELEQERGITINSANISIPYEHEGTDHLINLIDTPGHVDFGGDVIRAMRAVDGCVIVACAVEGTMPQTETVVRQALRENVKPVLFINKVDRLIKELEVTPEEMQQRFVKIIADVNKLIAKNAPEGKADAWLVKAENGTVSFGSAFQHWAISVPYMKKTGISFGKIFEMVKADQTKELSKKVHIAKVVFDMVIKHLPSPVEAQKYRTKKIWSGDMDTPEGQGMLTCDANAPVMMMVTNVDTDPHAGEVLTGRIFSGTIRKGTDVFLIDSHKTAKVQQVNLYMGGDRVMVDEISAGNIGSLVGLKEGFAGETISSTEKTEPFEGFLTKTEPVIVMAVEAKNMKDLPKLISVLHGISKADPNVKVEINQDTGEHLVAGMGELHLEIVQYRIEHDNGIPISTSPPIVLYNETIGQNSNEVMGKSPNKHNKFFFKIEPLDQTIVNAIHAGDIKEGPEKNKDRMKVRTEALIKLGMDRDIAKKVLSVYNGNIIVDGSKGVQYLFETRNLIIQGFEEAMKKGPISNEAVTGVKVTLTDASLHEDAIHRGPAQVLPAVRRPIYACLLQSGIRLKEPTQYVHISTPQNYLGSVSTEMNARRAIMEDIQNEGDQAIIKAKAPVKEMIGFAAAIRSATQGRVLWTTEAAGYEFLPRELQDKTVAEIRKRKGLDPKPRDISFYLE